MLHLFIALFCFLVVTPFSAKCGGCPRRRLSVTECKGRPRKSSIENHIRLALQLLNSAMSSNNIGPDELAAALAGAGGGVLSMALTYPLLTITTKLQAEEKLSRQENRQRESATQVIKEHYRKYGVTGFYNGLESAIYGMAITNFVYYYFYEWTTKSVQRVRQHERLNTLESMFTGAVAGSATAIASNPIWVANTRMTVTKSRKNTLAAILEIVKDDGILTLFSGLKPALLLVINPIIQYTVFEQLKNFLLASRGGQTLPAGWAFLFGAIGKLLATGLTYPYITIKTRLHLERQKNGVSSESFLEVIRKSGLSGLYNGISYKLVQSILTAALLFYFKEGLTLWSMKILRIMRQLFEKRKLQIA
ncbi:(ZYRO0B02354g) [Zygosaccharomyces parabailii]|nr:(ZYRO0B02354g) [Zygosaccharomyces parabailii]